MMDLHGRKNQEKNSNNARNETDSTSNSDNTTVELEHNEDEEVPDVLYQVKVRQRRDKIDTAGKWTKEGMKRLNDLITMVQEGRNGSRREQFEMLLQNKYVDYADANIELRDKNKRRRELEDMVTRTSNKKVIVKNVLNLGIL